MKKHDSRGKCLRAVPCRRKETRTQFHTISKALPHKGWSFVEHTLAASLLCGAGSAWKGRHNVHTVCYFLAMKASLM